MRTLGVDVAAQARGTATAVVEWGERAVVVGVEVGREDGQIIEEMVRADCCGIDCPLGWPMKMVGALARYANDGVWSGVDKAAFRYRRTDLAVIERVREQTGKPLYPLSVSSDRIAIAAWRVAGLRELLDKRFDRAGSDNVFEVYPAAALQLWGLDRRGYKGSGDAGRVVRARLLAAIREAAPWLEWEDPSLESACVDSDHALDALVASLVTRAAALALTYPIEPGDLSLAREEGWIHLPRTESLGQLLAVEGESGR